MSAASNKFIEVRRLDHAPDAELANELDAFERQFSYPLGPGHRFSILHGPDYRGFFSAIGEAAIFIAHVDGAVSGTLGSALRQVRTPQGSIRTVAYLCDLKVSPWLCARAPAARSPMCSRTCGQWAWLCRRHGWYAADPRSLHRQTRHARFRPARPAGHSSYTGRRCRRRWG